MCPDSAVPPASSTVVYTFPTEDVRAAFAGEDLGDLAGTLALELLSGTLNKANVSGDITGWTGVTFDHTIAAVSIHMTNVAGHTVATTGLTEFLTGDLANIDAPEVALDLWTSDGGTTVFAKATRRET